MSSLANRTPADCPRSPPVAYLRALFADPVFQGYLLTLAVVVALYVLPILSDVQRAALGHDYLDPICMTWTVAACFVGLRGVRDARERRFWFVVGTGLSLWVAVLWLYVGVPAQTWSMRWDVATDTMFLLFYLCLLIAFEIEPHLRNAPVRETLDGRLKMIGLACLALGWLLYSLLLPAVVLGDRYNEFLPVWLGYLVLDAIVVIRLAGLRLTCRSPRWRVLYATLLAAIVIQAALDTIDAARAIGALNSSPGSLLWLLSVLPSLGYVAAIRLRHAPHAPGELDDAESGESDERSRSLSVGSFLVLGAFSFPVIHLALQALDLVPPGFEVPGVIVVVASMLTMAGLTVVAYRTIEERRVVMEREQLDLDARLLQAQKMEAVGSLAGGVAHDFNNLLTAIGGYTDLALDGLPANAAARDVLGEVRLAADRATALTRQLLAFSRRQLLTPEPILLNNTVQAMERSLRRLAGTNITLVTDLAANVGFISADPGQIDQVLLNLVVNATDAMAGGGTVTISTAVATMSAEGLLAWPKMTPASCVRLQVRDTGVGISPDILPRIFDPFFTTKASGQGTGLGLATVYGIVSQSGGAITVSSQLGHGTTFSVFFAQIQTSQSVEARRKLPLPQPGTETILLVEDEPGVRALARSMLERCGYTVLAATCGDEAIEIHRGYQGSIDLLLTDVVMPGISGRTLSERLVAGQPDLKVLFITGYTDDAVVQHGVLDGRVTLLPKPFTRQSLSSAVRGVLDRPSTRLESASPPVDRGLS